MFKTCYGPEYAALSAVLRIFCLLASRIFHDVSPSLITGDSRLKNHRYLYAQLFCARNRLIIARVDVTHYARTGIIGEYTR